jgi:hypothetical protein
MRYQRLHFVHVEQNTDSHQKELALAKARSHTATINHWKKHGGFEQTALRRLSKRTGARDERSWKFWQISHNGDSREDPKPASSPSPVTLEPPALLRQCEADPFDCMGFQITPEMRRIIFLARTYFLPSLYVYPFMQRLSARCPPGVDPSSVGHQLAKGSASSGWAFGASMPAWICDHITSLLPFHEGQQKRELQRLALQLKHRSFCSLRDQLVQISNSTSILDIDVFVHVMWLHGAECVARNWAAAKVHARALTAMLDMVRDRPELMTLIIIIQYNDTELCTRVMQKTTMDFEACFKQKLENFVWEHQNSLPKAPKFDGTLNPVIASSSFLRPIFIRLRHFLALGDDSSCIESPKPLSGKVLWIWISSLTQQDTAKLLNRFLDLTSHKNRTLPTGLRFLEACLTLTTLHLLRKYFHESPMRGVDLRDCSQSIMTRLRLYLKLAIEFCTPEEIKQHQAAFFWMFFTIVQHDVRLNPNSMPTNGGGRSMSLTINVAGPSWSNTKFAEFAHTTGATTWPGARRILQQFLYTDHYEPHAKAWYKLQLHHAVRLRLVHEKQTQQP